MSGRFAGRSEGSGRTRWAGGPASASWGAVIGYCGLSYGLAWLVCLPLWLGEGLESPLALPLMLIMMATPGTAALVVVRLVEHRPVLGELGIRPTTSAPRMIAWLGISVVSVLVIVVLALLLSAACRVFQLDLGGMSAYREALAAQLAGTGQSIEELGLPVRLLWLIQPVNIVIGGGLNSVPALGEELGWRGFLFPRLRELIGPGWAVLAQGIIWAGWHAPVILLGYNYPSNPGLGVPAMMLSCVAVGALLSWLVERGGSVWQAALGHGTYNAAAGGFQVLLGAAGQQIDTFQAGVLGWASWPMWVVLVSVLLLTGGLRALRPG